jgi:hypothetical protein
MSIVTREQALEILDNYAADDPLEALRNYAECLSEYRIDMCAIAEPAAAIAHAWDLLTPERQAYCIEAARTVDLNRYIPDRLAPERPKAIEIVREFRRWEPSRSPPASAKLPSVLIGLPPGSVSPPPEGTRP